MAAGLVIPKGSLIPGIAEVTRKVDSNVTAANFDLVNVQSAQLEIADATEMIAGYINDDRSSITSSSEDVEIVVTPFTQVVMDNDNTGATFASTHAEGSYVFDITGGTGAQIVDTNTAATRYNAGSAQLLCLEYNPQNIRDDLDDDTSVGLFMILEAQFGLL